MSCRVQVGVGGERQKDKREGARWDKEEEEEEETQTVESARQRATEDMCERARASGGREGHGATGVAAY